MLNRLEEGSGFYDTTMVNIKSVITDVLDSLRMRIEENGHNKCSGF
ncbi:MAG: hypothetical protein R2744_12725 [Bacteroidales bacterium]